MVGSRHLSPHPRLSLSPTCRCLIAHVHAGYSTLATTLSLNEHNRPIKAQYDNMPRQDGVQVAFNDAFPTLVRAAAIAVIVCLTCSALLLTVPPDIIRSGDLRGIACGSPEALLSPAVHGAVPSQPGGVGLRAVRRGHVASHQDRKPGVQRHEGVRSVA